MVTHPESTSTSAFTSTLQSRLGGMAVIIIAVLLFILDGARLTNVWPCDIACQGGAHYQTVAGISVIWIALISHAGLIALAWRDVRRGGWCPWYIRYVWFLTGVSAFFTWISSDLQLVCPYCIIIHVATLVILCLSVPFPRAVRGWQATSWLVTGFLVMNFIFHHQIVSDTAASTTTTTTPPSSEGLATRLAADKGRTYGAATAPQTIALIIDLTCRHCAEQYEPLMEALKPALAAGQVRVIIHHLVRPSQPAALPATELVFAAAAVNQHAIAMDILLGTNPDASASGLTARLAEVIDTATLTELLTTYHSDISAVIAEDQQRIQQLGLGPRTPSAALLVEGRITKRWSGNLPVANIVSALGHN